MRAQKKSSMSQTIEALKSWARGPRAPMDEALARRSRELWPGAASEVAALAGQLDAQDGEPWRLAGWLEAARALAPLSEKELSERARYESGHMGAQVARAWSQEGHREVWGQAGPRFLPLVALLDDALGWGGPIDPAFSALDRALGVAVNRAARASTAEEKSVELESVRLWLEAGANPNAPVARGWMRGSIPPLEAALSWPRAWECSALLAEHGAKAGQGSAFDAAKAIQLALTQREIGVRSGSHWGSRESQRRVEAAIAIAKGLGRPEDFRTKKGHSFARSCVRTLFGHGIPRVEAATALASSEIAWREQDFADIPDGLIRAKRVHKLASWSMASRAIKGRSVADGAWAQAFDDARRMGPWDATTYAQWIIAWARQSQWSESTLWDLAREARHWMDADSGCAPQARQMESQAQELAALAQAREIEKGCQEAAPRSRPKGL